MDTIEIVEKNECSGCSACSQKCPKNAIVMIENEEGFLYPSIDKDKCINCGLCSKVCPQLKKVEATGSEYPKAYAMYNKNSNELKKSSSGGIFSAIANYVFENKGIVFGAAYNDNLDVNHIKAENEDELSLLRSSKYVQSNINNTYKDVEKNLKDDRMVFFTGTPCQVAGLKSFLVKEYDNLITCDLVCHGVPSQKLFHKYIDYLSNKYKSKVISYNFRSKEKYGWGLYAEVKTKDGKIRLIKPDFDPYYSNFLESNTYRENCYKCHYTNYNRVSNITLADYWGISSIHPDFYSEEGRSLILVNNDKGKEVIEKIKERIELIETDIDIAANRNKNLIQPSYRSVKRNEIYQGISDLNSIEYVKERLTIKKSVKKYIKAIIPVKVQIFLKKCNKR